MTEIIGRLLAAACIALGLTIWSRAFYDQGGFFFFIATTAALLIFVQLSEWRAARKKK